MATPNTKSQTDPTPAAAAAPDPVLYVEDTTATPQFPERVHHMTIAGRVQPITFKLGEKLRLPPDVALKFLVDEAFIVTDESGERIVPPPKSPGPTEELRLKTGECVARLDELTIDALLLRAKPLPGGEGLSRAAGKERVIAFITAHQARQMPRGTAGRGARVLDADGLGQDAMDDDSLNSMFSDVAA